MKKISWFAVFVLTVVFSVSAGEENKPREWRHEGIVLNDKDIEKVRERLEQEPWQSAWQDVIAKANVDSGSVESASSVLDINYLYALAAQHEIQPATDTEQKIVQQIGQADFSGLTEYEPKVAAQIVIAYAIAYEAVRDSSSLLPEIQFQFKQSLIQHIRDDQETAARQIYTLPWMGAKYMACAVVLEDENLYKQGERIFIDTLQELYDDEGNFHYRYPFDPFGAQHQLEMVSCMTLMAEIANHHSDLFWGNDLYHYPVGANTLEDLCQEIYPKAVQVSSATDAEQHWGWLELAYKTYGEPQWLDTLQQQRPVFDSWTAGPVTLMHALVNQAGTPDYGEAEDGFTWLYNRENLQGWQMSSRWYDIDPDDFYVEDGIVYTRGASDHWLMTDRMYKNFILRLDYKIGAGSNSGILFWAAIPGRPSKTGFEIQLLDDSGQPPKINGSGSLYNILAPIENAQKPAGEWNSLEIACNDPHLKVTMNDKVVQDINLNDLPETASHRRRGYIGLQDHAHKVQFRNMRIKVLEEIKSDKESEKKSVEEPETEPDKELGKDSETESESTSNTESEDHSNSAGKSSE
jgi:hypothetical protein